MELKKAEPRITHKSDRNEVCPGAAQRHSRRRRVPAAAKRLLLLGTRGRSPVALADLVRVIDRFATMAVQFRADIAAVDISPLVVGPRGVIAVDATVTTIRDGDRNLGTITCLWGMADDG